ncbi:MAG TPA: GNAT family N-acetyltransferase [Anaerovoracaceae bacterium]|nr:GNAT family N-acetyltransferase [Anaerovoracaceae bacterium]
MEIINFSQHYEKEVVDLWNTSLTADPVTVMKFRRQALFDDNFDAELCFAAVENDRLIGFLLATKRKFPYLERGLEPTRGWINVMFVDEDFRRRGVGKALAGKAEEKLKSMGAETVTLGAYSPNYFFPGVDMDNYKAAVKFFEEMGYEAGKASYSMCKNLHGYQIGRDTLDKLAKAQEAGFRFIGFDYRYALELLDFLRDEFGGGWKRNALISMQNSTAEDCILLVLDREEKIAGFCMRMIDGNPMRFGPFGIRAEARNYGIGGVLFDLMQLEMEKRGIYHLYFVSTDEPGKRFYERHGLKVFRTFADYQKTI